jgi:regulator of protease activity HflC (stomatin/prohibitin superfamily)
MENNINSLKSNVTKIVSIGALGLFGMIVLLGSVYTVEEGHIGIVKRFNEAKSQVNPGLHFKFSFHRFCGID